MAEPAVVVQPRAALMIIQLVRLGRTACRLQWLGQLCPSVALPNKPRVEPHAVAMIDHAEQKQASLKKELEDRVNMAQNHTVAVDEVLSIGERPLQITGIPEQHMIQEFSPHRPDQPFHKGV